MPMQTRQHLIGGCSSQTPFVSLMTPFTPFKWWFVCSADADADAYPEGATSKMVETRMSDTQPTPTPNTSTLSLCAQHNTQCVSQKTKQMLTAVQLCVWFFLLFSSYSFYNAAVIFCLFIYLFFHRSFFSYRPMRGVSSSTCGHENSPFCTTIYTWGRHKLAYMHASKGVFAMGKIIILKQTLWTCVSNIFKFNWTKHHFAGYNPIF